MKAFFHAHAGAFGRRALRRYRLRLEQRKCGYRGLHGLRVLPYLARNICGHLIPLRTSFAKWDFNIGLRAYAFKARAIETCDCRRRFNDKTNLPRRAICIQVAEASAAAASFFARSGQPGCL
jgi:hypothetical protein